MPQVDDIRRLWSEGRDVTDISHMTGHDRKTVRKYLRMDDFSPEAPAPRPRGTSKLDPFKDYIDRTLEATCTSGASSATPPPGSTARYWGWATRAGTRIRNQANGRRPM